jgi:hypothetical protein
MAFESDFEVVNWLERFGEIGEGLERFLKASNLVLRKRITRDLSDICLKLASDLPEMNICIKLA